MMKRVLMALLLGVFVGAPWAWAGSCTRLVVTGHPDYPPVSWAERGQIKGASADLVNRIAGELGLEVEFKDMGSWQAAQQATREGRADIIFGIYKNAERAAYLDYLEPAYMIDPVVIMTQAGKPFDFRSWEDLKGKKGVTNAGESYGPEFDAYMAKNLEVQRSQGAPAAFEALVNGRADYVIMGLYPGLAMAASLGLRQKIEVLPQQLSAFGMFVAFSKKSACSGQTKEAFERRIAQLKESGAIQTMLILAQTRWEETHR